MTYTPAEIAAMPTIERAVDQLLEMN